MAWENSIIRPNGDSTPLQWSITVFPATHAGQVDETPPDEDFTYVYETTAGTVKTDVFTMQDLMDGSGVIPKNPNIKIQEVTLYARARCTNIPGFGSEPRIIVWWNNWQVPMSSSWNILGTSYKTFNASTSVIGSLFDNRPIEISDIDMLEVQINGLIIAGTRNTIRCTQVYATITWDYLKTPGHGRITWTP